MPLLFRTGDFQALPSPARTNPSMLPVSPAQLEPVAGPGQRAGHQRAVSKIDSAAATFPLHCPLCDKLGALPTPVLARSFLTEASCTAVCAERVKRRRRGGVQQSLKNPRRLGGTRSRIKTATIIPRIKNGNPQEMMAWRNSRQI